MHYLSSDPLEILADAFTHAFYHKQWIGPSESHIVDLSPAEAYRVQDLVASKRSQRGERPIGYKVGCTSEKVRQQFGLEEPIYAHLFSPYIYQNHHRLKATDYCQCAIEPEMVLVMAKDLQGIDLSREELVGAIEYVCSGIELHDLQFWYDPPSSNELICSGGLHTGLVLGDEKVSPQQLSFSDEYFSAYVNDELISQAPAYEIMGGPIQALRWLVNSLTQKSLSLKKGSLVIPGSPVAMVPITQDAKVSIDITKIGTVTTHLLIDESNEYIGTS